MYFLFLYFIFLLHIFLFIIICLFLFLSFFFPLLFASPFFLSIFFYSCPVKNISRLHEVIGKVSQLQYTRFLCMYCKVLEVYFHDLFVQNFKLFDVKINQKTLNFLSTRFHIIICIQFKSLLC